MIELYDLLRLLGAGAALWLLWVIVWWLPPRRKRTVRYGYSPQTVTLRQLRAKVRVTVVLRNEAYGPELTFVGYYNGMEAREDRVLMDKHLSTVRMVFPVESPHEDFPLRVWVNHDHVAGKVVLTTYEPEPPKPKKEKGEEQ